MPLLWMPCQHLGFPLCFLLSPLQCRQLDGKVALAQLVFDAAGLGILRHLLDGKFPESKLYPTTP